MVHMSTEVVIVRVECLSQMQDFLELKRTYQDRGYSERNLKWRIEDDKRITG